MRIKERYKKSKELVREREGKLMVEEWERVDVDVVIVMMVMY